MICVHHNVRTLLLLYLHLAYNLVYNLDFLLKEYEDELARLRQENLWMRHRLGFAQDLVLA